MAHFDVYEYRGREHSVRYLIDIQHPILDRMATRVVVPLRLFAPGTAVIEKLNPVVEIGSEKYWVGVQQVANISVRQLGRRVGSALAYRDRIVDAFDMLMLGI